MEFPAFKGAPALRLINIVRLRSLDTNVEFRPSVSNQRKVPRPLRMDYFETTAAVSSDHHNPFQIERPKHI